jgi:Ca-activated chloride channel family protein
MWLLSAHWRQNFMDRKASSSEPFFTKTEKAMKTIYTLLAVLCCLWVASADAQATLKGTVLDLDTEEPLIFTTVVLMQNGVVVAGAQSDFDGNYEIKNINAGVYDLEANYIGYQKTRIEQIVLKEGEVKVLDVKMGGGVELDEIEVIAYHPPLVEQDNTTRGATITSSDIRRLPGKQRNKKGRTNIKGSRRDASNYYIDGVRVSGKKAKKNKSKQDEQWNTEEYTQVQENDFLNPANAALSTFSIDVDNASYSNIRRQVNSGRMPADGSVRIEEMVNYFFYDYPRPQGPHPFEVYTELGDCPWTEGHLLMHIGLQGLEVDFEDTPPNNLTFLIDVSGSMSSVNKLELVKPSLRLLVEQLRPQDRVAIVVYAGAAGVVLESTPGSQKEKILESIDRLQAGGSTAGGAGIRLAYNIAKSNFMKDGNNRVILATDGDFNVGVSSTASLEKLVSQERKSGVYLTVLGFGMGNYKDNRMETLADKGNGNYAYIDNFKEAKKVFENQLTGTLLTIAKDVKIQVEFNPKLVASYRLIGYENRLLEDKDFNDDTKDAGELGAGHTVTALYEIIPVSLKEDPKGSVDPLRYQQSKLTRTAKGEELAYVKLRYKKPKENKSRLLEQSVQSTPKSFLETTSDFQFTAAVAGFGMMLMDSKHKGEATYSKVIDWASPAMGKDQFGYRTDFVSLVQQCETLNVTTSR